MAWCRKTPCRQQPSGGFDYDFSVTWVLCCTHIVLQPLPYSDVIMCAMASQITRVSIVCSTVVSGRDQRKHQSSASLAFVWGINRWPVNSPHKMPVTRKICSFDDVIMNKMIKNGRPIVSLSLMGPSFNNESGVWCLDIVATICHW